MRAFQQELDFAVEAVREGSRLALRIQREYSGRALDKEDDTPVTVADFSVQAVIARMLMRRFGQDPLVAEESSRALRGPDSDNLARVTEYVRSLHQDADPDRICEWIDRGTAGPGPRFWTLDPIDGTAGYLRGDQYVVALALIVRGEVVAAAMGCPQLNEDLQPHRHTGGVVVVGHKGQISWVEPLEGGKRVQLNVSGQDSPAGARLLHSVEEKHTDFEVLARIRQELGNEQPVWKMDSQAKYAVLAGGHAELIFRLISPYRPQYKEKIWDQAAGTLIVEGAGGRVTDLSGAPLDFSAGRTLSANTGVVVSNGHLHSMALQAVEAAGARRSPGG